MSPRVGSTAPKPISLKMRPSEDVSVTRPTHTTVDPDLSARKVGDLSFEMPSAKKKPVNMTGRHKPVTRAPVPVKENLAGDVTKLRYAAAAGATTSTAKTPLERVQKMSNEQLAACVEKMRAGKLTDQKLKIAVASEIAARTSWGKANPEAVSVMRDLIANDKLRFEEVDPKFEASPEQLVQRVADYAQIEHDDSLARIAQATRSAAKGAAGSSARIPHVDGSLNPKAPYDKLPSDLKNKMAENVWRDLDQNDRKTLMSTYTRLKGWGVWDEVKTVKGQLNPTEPHAHVGGMEFEVPGNTGGVVFEAKDARKFKEALLSTGHFGVDKGVVGSLHQGQDSMREWTQDPGSLHVSVGPGAQFDTHMDKHSPVGQPKRGETVIDPEKGFDHHRNEVWPEMIRNVIGLPGVIIDVSTKPNPRGGMPEVRGTIGVELHGPVKSDKKTVDRKALERINQTPGKGEPGPEGLISNAVDQIDLSKVKFPRPAGVAKDDAIDPRAMAEAMAGLMLEAARAGKDPIHIDLVDYAHLVKMQPGMTKEMQALAKQVYQQVEAQLARLPPDQRAAWDLKKVKSLKVTYGVKNQGARVPLKD